MDLDELPRELIEAPWIYRAVDHDGPYGDPAPTPEDILARNPDAAVVRERAAAGLAQRQIIRPYASPIATWRP